jgi:flagellar biosynthesis protein FlhG
MLDAASAMNATRDQATGLREMFEPPPGLAVLPMAATRLGTGFHSLVTNIAACYARSGQRVIVIDTSAKGVAHALGLRINHDLANLLSGEREFHDVAVSAAEGFHVLKAQKGIPEFARTAGDPAELFLGFRRLAEPFDIAILAGHVADVAAMTRSQDDVVFVTNPESEALTATYAGIKRAHAEHGQNAFRLLINRVDDEHEGIVAFKRLADTARKFLGVSIEYGGSIPRDAAFVAAERAQCSVYHVASAGGAATQISQLVQSMQAWRLGRYALNES